MTNHQTKDLVDLDILDADVVMIDEKVQIVTSFDFTI